MTQPSPTVTMPLSPPSQPAQLSPPQSQPQTMPALKDAVPLHELRRALVVKLRHHGDVLLASPVLSALRRAAPQCEVDALAYADTRDMLDGHPALAQLHLIDRRWKSSGLLTQLKHEWQLLRTLRARRYDIIINLTEHRRGAWLARVTGARWAVAPRHQQDWFWRRSFTHLVAQPSQARRHMVERNLDAMRRIGLVVADSDKRVVLVPGKAATERIEALLAQQGLSTQPFIHLHMTSRWMFKAWPLPHVTELLRALQTRGHAVVLTAAPDAQEMAFNAAAAQAAPGVVDLSGQLSLKELAALTARAQLFVGVDSAPMHIAAAMGTPSVALFGPSGELEWGPWRVPYQVVASHEHPCRPCGLDGCGGGKISECLTQLPVAHVLQACERLLAQAEPSHRAMMPIASTAPSAP